MSLSKNVCSAVDAPSCPVDQVGEETHQEVFLLKKGSHLTVRKPLGWRGADGDTGARSSTGGGRKDGVDYFGIIQLALLSMAL